MPGYLSNRLISIDIASMSDLTDLQSTINSSISTTNSNLSNLTTRVTEAEGNIEDLQLQIGV